MEKLNVAVYCGASLGKRPEYAKHAAGILIINIYIYIYIIYNIYIAGCNIIIAKYRLTPLPHVRSLCDNNIIIKYLLL